MKNNPLIGRFARYAYRSLRVKAFAELVTEKAKCHPKFPDSRPVGVIAGNKPKDPSCEILARQFELVARLLKNPDVLRNDGVVTVSSTMCDEMIEHQIFDLAHTQLPLDDGVILMTDRFLRHGTFAEEPSYVAA